MQVDQEGRLGQLYPTVLDPTDSGIHIQPPYLCVLFIHLKENSP